MQPTVTNPQPEEAPVMVEVWVASRHDLEESHAALRCPHCGEVGADLIREEVTYESFRYWPERGARNVTGRKWMYSDTLNVKWICGNCDGVVDLPATWTMENE